MKAEWAAFKNILLFSFFFSAPEHPQVPAESSQKE